LAAPAADLPSERTPAARASDLRFDLHGGHFDVRVAPRRQITREDGLAELGLEFTPGQDAQVARLAVAIFQGRVALELVDAARSPRRRARRATRPTRAAA